MHHTMDNTALLITFYGKDRKRKQFICDGFIYASMVMGSRTYAWTVMAWDETNGQLTRSTMDVRGVHQGRAR